MQKMILKFTPEQLMLMNRHLIKAPYEEVALLISDINKQLSEDINQFHPDELPESRA